VWEHFISIAVFIRREIAKGKKENAMKKLLPLSLILIAALILGACASARSEAPSNFLDVGGTAPMMPQEQMYAPAPEAAYDQSTTANSGSGVSATSVERLVIQNADLAIVVSDVKGRMQNVQVMAQQMGGFVVSSNLYQSYTNDYIEVPEAKITIRVPAEKLDAALEQIKKDVVEVQNENRSGQDVTAEYVDLQSRLKNYEAAEAQLEKILENATETEDVVNVFNQLVYYREQIELVKGQMKYYEEAAALSAISIRIIAEETIKPIVIGKWEPQGVALEAIQDLINFLKGFVDFLIRFVILILPVLIIIFGLFYLVFLGLRAIFRKLRGSKPKREQPQDTSVEKK
jgi:tetratricopeptide (TPR) repeat protein